MNVHINMGGSANMQVTTHDKLYIEVRNNLKVN